MIKLSTQLRNNLAGTTGFAATFANGVMEIRTGAQPADADQAATGTLIGLVTLNSAAFTPGTATNGLTFAAAASGAVAKTGVWSFVGINAPGAGLTAGWFRLRGNAADVGALSTVLPRLDGSIGTSGADLNLSNLTVVTGAPTTIDTFTWTQPAY